MRALLQRVERSIREHGILIPGQRVLVAVSGGVDSMVLLHLLARLSRRHHWQLTVAHFNHQLRGSSSDADELFVAEAAASLGLEFHSGRGNVRAHAKRRKLSIEQAARTSRHQFLAKTAKHLQIPTIALAHHADDQVELFFLRLLRGAGGEGLAGMKWQGPSPEDATVTLVRPLLSLSKSELSNFSRRTGLSFREDATNQSTDILRNRIRCELLPQLQREYQPAIASVVARIMEIVGAESELAADEAARWLELAAAPAKPPPGGKTFRELPVAVQRCCIKDQLIRARLVPDFATIEALRGNPQKAVSVSPRLAVLLTAGGRLKRLRACTASSDAASSQNELPLGIAGKSGRGQFGGMKFEWKRQRGSSRPSQTTGTEHFDAAQIGSQVILRHWRPGDRFQPIGMASSVKLQDMLTNAKIPRAKRSRLTIATTAAGEIFWVEGLRISERFKITNATSELWRWRWLRTTA